MSLLKDELLTIYHSARSFSEDHVSNNPNGMGKANVILGFMKRELSGVTECTEFDEKKKCKNRTCQNGLHAA